MARTKQKNEQLRNATKEKIVDAALTVFARKGFSATSISDIAKTADISTGLLYRHFESKQELFDHIIDFAVEGLRGLTTVLGSDGNPKQILENVCKEMIEAMNDEGYLKTSAMITQGLASADNSAYHRVVEADKNMLEAVSRLIQRGQADGVFALGDSMRKSTFLFSTIQGMTEMSSLFKQHFKAPTVEEMTAFLYLGDYRRQGRRNPN